MELWIGALNLGFLYSFMTMGVFITFRVHDFPDITVDGSFTAGAAVAAVLMVWGVNPFVALLAAFGAGAVAGSITALIHTRLNINGLLAGILVMTGLYSINLHVMGRSNIPLLNQTTLFTYLEKVNPGLHTEVWITLALLAIMGLFWCVMSLFFKTDMGIAMRVTGNNPDMAAAAGIYVGRMTVFGVALANGLVGVSGGLVAQYQGFADIGMGIGTIVIGLAAVIIGESVLRMRSMAAVVLSVILGSVIFRLMIAVALYVGMNPIDLKLLTAAFVLITLIVSKRIGSGRKVRGPLFTRLSGFLTGRRIILGLVGIGSVLLGLGLLKNHEQGPSGPSKACRIGMVQVADHGLLNITRDSFVEEMKRLGYREGDTCVIMCENANGDLPTVNTILDKFLQRDVDIVVPISTACTQAAINKVKDRPVVFATVANPFIIDAGSSETDHLPNVTGVYGWIPMDRTMEIVRRLVPGKLTIGSIWDPAHANSVFNVENLKKAAAAYGDVSFEGATITGSSEVYDAARSLVNKGIDAFVLSPDNIVYSAFESVVKAARSKKIPIFMSDVERLQDGALATLGYDYRISGIQAARLTDRILKGEDPGQIPFERYRKITFGLNLKAAKDLGITIPPGLLAEATQIHGLKTPDRKRPTRIGVVQFASEPNVELCKEGILKALEDNGYVDGKNVEIIYKNAQADFSTINAIIQDFMRRKVDIIVPLSTPCAQAAVQLAGKTPGMKVVFTYIYNPYRIGAAKTPDDHLPNMTGVSCQPPIEKMLDLIKEMFPDRKKIGIVWNSSEANSEATLLKIRPYASKIGLKIIEATVTGPGEVLDASRSLTVKGAQVFLNAGDNTLNVSFDSFAKVADGNGIPLFSVDSELIDNSLVAFGPDFYQTGYDGGTYLARVLNGENTADLPIYATEKTAFIINADRADRHGFKIDKQILKRADRIIGQKHETARTEGEPEKRAVLFMFSDHDALLETARGVTEQLEKSGILRQHNMTVDTKSAQNEFYLAQSIAQDIVRQEYDLVITLSTPVLQVMARANQTIPHIFGAVTDPYQTGVVKGPHDHPSHITGVATSEPVETTIQVMRELLPHTRRIGMIWNPAEACSEICTLKARKAAAAYGFELIESTVSGPAEIGDALRSLMSKEIDVFYTSGDNTVASVQKTVNQILRKAKIPCFTNVPSDVESGALVSIGADFYEVGQEIARVAARVIAGESPKDIPIKNFAPEKRWVNADIAKEYGIKLSQGFLDRAAQVIRTP